MIIVSLTLTCKDDIEATTIIQALLEKRLIACAKISQIASTFYWKDVIEHGQETLVVMESELEKFDEIEATVKSLHSYETFVLQAYPVIKVSAGVEKWIKTSLLLN